MKDFAGNELEVGDLVLDNRTKAYRVMPTETTEIERGLSCRCQPVRGKGPAVSLPFMMLVKVTAEQLAAAPERLDRERLWHALTARAREAGREAMRERHRKFEAVRNRIMGA